MSTAEISAKINNLKELLTRCGLNSQADLTSILSIADNDTCRIAVAGETLKGKSTFINKLLCRDVLPTFVIPSSSPLIVKYGAPAIVTAKGVIPYDKAALQNLLEEEQDTKEQVGALSVSCPDEWLEKTGFEIFETNGLNIIQDEIDLLAMTDILNCDGIVFAVSAEQLFSVNETDFIEQYLKLVSSNIIVVITKLDLIPADEHEKVIEYAKQKIQSFRADIPFFILSDNDHNHDNFFDAEKIKDTLARWKIDSNETRHKKNGALLDAVEAGFVNYVNTITELRSKEKTDLDRQKKASETARETAAVKMEKIILEIDSRKLSRVKSFANLTDAGINKIYNQVKPELNTELDTNTVIEQALLKLAAELDAAFEKDCLDDIGWVNDVIYTEYGFSSKPPSFQDKLNSNSNFKENEKIDISITDFSKIKRYTPIGIAGLTTIGYFAFRIVGALLCFGGGVGFYLYINNKNDAQSAEAEKFVENSLRKTGRAIKEKSEKEFDAVYANITSQYKQEIQAYIDGKYTADFRLEEKRKEEITRFEAMSNNVISIMHQLRKELTDYAD